MRGPLLVTMSGPAGGDVDISKVSNFEAGILTLALIDRIYPGITFGELPALALKARPETMGRSWFMRQVSNVEDTLSPTKIYDTVTSKVGDIKDGIGDVLKDTFSASGDAAGSAVRLVTDKKVVDGLNSSYESFTKSGGVRGAVVGSGSLTDYFSSTTSYDDPRQNALMDFITQLGASAKAGSQGIPPAVLWVGGGILALLLLRRH